MTEPEFVSYRKIVVFGDTQVGKSALIQRLEKDEFLEESDNQNCNINNNKILLNIIKYSRHFLQKIQI